MVMSFGEPTDQIEGSLKTELKEISRTQKHHKYKHVLRAVLIGMGIVLVISGAVFVALDYYHFKNDDSSVFFKQKLSYGQSDRVPVGNLVISIDKVSHTQGGKGFYVSCNLPDARNVYTSPFSEFSNCLNHKIFEPPPYNGDAEIDIAFRIHNGSSNLVDLNNYKFSVVANTNLNVESMDLKSKNILANSDISASYSGHMDDGYKGIYGLVINHKAIQKTIAITKF